VYSQFLFREVASSILPLIYMYDVCHHVEQLCITVLKRYSVCDIKFIVLMWAYAAMKDIRLTREAIFYRSHSPRQILET